MPGGVPNTSPANTQEIEAAEQDRWDVDDLIDGVTVSDSEYRTVFQVQSDRSTKFAPGYGYRDDNHAEGYADFGLQVADDTAGTNAADAKGKYRWEVYGDSDKESPIAFSGTFRASELRTSVSSNRKDKTVISQMAPAAPEDGYVVLAYKGKTAEDGQVTYDGGSSDDVGIPYARFKL